MSNPPSRLRNILGHLIGSSTSQSQPKTQAAQDEYTHTHHIHQLSPTFFLQRAAAIEPEAEAIYHVTANGRILRRSYIEFADRARGLAYYLVKHGFKRVGVLAPNTPAFLESIYGIVAGGGVIVPVNYRLKQEDIAYIFDFAEVDAIVVDAEYVHLLDLYRKDHAQTPVIIDNVSMVYDKRSRDKTNGQPQDTDATEGELSGPFDDAVLEGLNYDSENGSKGWAGLPQVVNEDDMLAIPFTSGTTSKPKGVIYTHRGAYLAALANVVESGLNYHKGRCKYLWTLPMYVLPHPIPNPRQTTDHCNQVSRHRLDLPLVRRRRARHKRLPPEDRLPADLAPPQRRGHNALQRRAHRKHAPLRLPIGLPAPLPRPRDRGRFSAYRAPLRADDQAQPASRARLRPDRDLRPDHQGVSHATLGRSALRREIREDGEAGTRVHHIPARAGGQARPRGTRPARRRRDEREGDRRDHVPRQHLREGVLQGPRSDPQALSRGSDALWRLGRVACRREHPDPGPG